MVIKRAKLSRRHVTANAQLKKMATFSLSFFTVQLFLFLLLGVIVSAVPDQVIKNAAGAVVFEVIDGRLIRLVNRHRNKAANKLQFSIHPPIVETIKLKEGSTSTWILHLNDNTNAELAVLEKGENTEFSWLWHGGGANADRDVCFNYAYNGASW